MDHHNPRNGAMTWETYPRAPEVNLSSAYGDFDEIQVPAQTRLLPRGELAQPTTGDAARGSTLTREPASGLAENSASAANYDRPECTGSGLGGTAVAMALLNRVAHRSRSCAR